MISLACLLRVEGRVIPYPPASINFQNGQDTINQDTGGEGELNWTPIVKVLGKSAGYMLS